MRMLMMLVRALRDLNAVTAPAVAGHGADEVAEPRNIDEFRNAIAARIEAFVAAHKAEDLGGEEGDRE